MSALNVLIHDLDLGHYSVEFVYAARAELAALRATVAAQARQIEAKSELINMLVDYTFSFRDKFAEQAGQLEQARELLTTLEWNDWSDKVDAWLAANAPAAPEAQQGGEAKMITTIISPCVVVLPWPDPVLWPNRSNGNHWSVRQSAKSAAKLIARSNSTGANIGDTSIDHAVTIIVEPPDKRRRDVDGVLSALKPSLDGIAHALDIDDCHFNPIQIVRAAPVPGGRVTVRIDDALPF